MPVFTFCNGIHRNWQIAELCPLGHEMQGFKYSTRRANDNCRVREPAFLTVCGEDYPYNLPFNHQCHKGKHLDVYDGIDGVVESKNVIECEYANRADKRCLQEHRHHMGCIANNMSMVNAACMSAQDPDDRAHACVEQPVHPEFKTG
ncbi:galactosyl transferase [Bifidobacterium pseudolongum subsp. globosum]|uniref:Galactosyl transferase n=1 Tax=Bifidobacterium pseudolongum subsp. globosum TaxID=1690 RepID=A0A2N3R443_9BIFI|nr:galactosyl transferase [Bifidobacterium pseudolongum subsp. globosum]